MSRIEKHGEEYKIIFDGLTVATLPTLYNNSNKIKVEYKIKTPEKIIHGDNTITLSAGCWLVSLGYAKEDCVCKDDLFGDIVTKKGSVIIQPIRIA